jgi:hypothetical protein
MMQSRIKPEKETHIMTETLLSTTALTPPVQDQIEVLRANAMLVSFSAYCCGFKRKDYKVTKKIAEEYGVSDKVGSYIKVLLPPHKTRGPADVIKETRELIERLTGSWKKPYRILPVANYDAYMSMLETQKIKFNKEVDRLEAAIPSLKEEARLAQGPMYREEEYGFLDNIRNRYAFVPDVQPIGQASGFICGLMDAHLEETKRTFETNMAANIKAAREAGAKTLHVVVSKIANDLKDYKVERIRTAGGRWKDQASRKLFDSLMTNLHDIVLPAVNAIGDPDLAEVIKDLETSDLLDHTVEDFRHAENQSIVETVQAQ